ncbi:MAG: tetratricopeptide repeat protein [Acidobacteria bacterium]|nr:tetratricopeptide repeat protein [Acidobacteriota bacterium]
MCFRMTALLALAAMQYDSMPEGKLLNLPVNAAGPHFLVEAQAKLVSDALHPTVPSLKQLAAAAALQSGANKKKDSGYVLQKVKEWRDASLLHAPGEPDRSAVEIGGWHQEDLEIVLDFITELASQSRRSIRRTTSKTPVRSRLRLTPRELEQGDLNRILKQGALLHTDIAVLGLETGSYMDSAEHTWIFLDGRVIAQPKKIHWKYARRLIDSVDPAPQRDAMVRQWYVATTAYLQSRRLLAYAKENIAGALDLFPSDDKILFYAAAQHETWASPVNQNVLLPRGGLVSYGSKEEELKKARDLYRKALKANPDFAEARLRLGRVLLLLEDTRRAYLELHPASERIQDPQLAYYTALYLGRALEALSRPDEARQQYESAARLFPTAQSPLLALSLLARRGGNDPEGAIAAVRRVFELPLGNIREDDPMWIYDLSHVRDADTLMREMLDRFGGLPR